MKARELIELLRKRPDADVIVSEEGDRGGFFEVERVAHMAHTTFIVVKAGLTKGEE